MSGIIQGVKNWIWDQNPAPARPAAVPANQAAEPQLYARNEKGWKTCNVEKLTEKQCDVISTDFGYDSNVEAFKAVAKGAAGIVAIAAVIIVAMVVAKIMAPLFIVALAKLGATLGQVAIIAIKGFVHLAAYGTAGLAIWKLYNQVYSTVLNHWNYSTHLSDLALKAAIKKASFAAPPPPVVAPAAAAAPQAPGPAANG